MDESSIREQEEVTSAAEKNIIKSFVNSPSEESGIIDLNVQDVVYGRLLGITGLGRCVITHFSNTELQEIFNVSMEQQNVPISISPIWFNTKPNDFYKNTETSDSMDKVIMDTANSIFRRPRDNRLDQEDLQTKHSLIIVTRIMALNVPSNKAQAISVALLAEQLILRRLLELKNLVPEKEIFIDSSDSIWEIVVDSLGEIDPYKQKRVKNTFQDIERDIEVVLHVLKYDISSNSEGKEGKDGNNADNTVLEIIDLVSGHKGIFNTITNDTTSVNNNSISLKSKISALKNEKWFLMDWWISGVPSKPNVSKIQSFVLYSQMRVKSNKEQDAILHINNF
ncbi:hypothetical protein BB560_006023 [Smittium megazygosporum]|uniref:Uncharacterized protein n=1 Tax=Smittium megazygosporum TaxID=133381 RepID=A0A2T9YKQ6_9FUNG|nr:hypothetical protein BB560_006023 [Smittium megazygosporum]